MLFASLFDSFQSMSGLQAKEVIHFCNNFHILNADAILGDLNSFTFFIKFMVSCRRYKVDKADRKPIDKNIWMLFP